MRRAQCQFEAWGTYVFLETGVSIGRAESIARKVLDEVGRACSRFRDDSDLVAVNRGAGSWVNASPVLLEALDVAVRAAEVTDGLVDPLLGRPLVELGYDRDFRDLVPRQTLPVTGARPGAWREIRIDQAGAAVRIPADTCLDLGATAKAWTSDVLATTICAELDTATLVSLGGDVRATAPAGLEEDWAIRVGESPAEALTSEGGAVFSFDGGGLATSSTTVRRWRSAGVERHHLLDPSTGLPVQGPWRTVTATGPTCVAANVATTSALVLQAGAVDWLSDRAVDARLIGDAGIVTTGHWPAQARPGAACSTS